MKKSHLAALGLTAAVLVSAGHAAADDLATGDPALKKALDTPSSAVPQQPKPTPAPPESSEAPAKKSGDVHAAGGYSYSDKTRTAAAAPRARAARGGPSASFPSFNATDGGGSRLVVHLSTSVPIEERKAAGSVTYILKGVHVRRWNDTNPLVTVHFNTPVSQARLVPHGADLHLVVDLRAASAPTFKVSPGTPQGAGAALEIDFPKGDFAAPVAAAAPTSAPSSTPTPRTVAPAPTATPAGPKP